MGQATSQIEAHIENTRAHLGSNLQELEQKVKSVTDWKHHFQTNPMMMMGAAFGGGILLATMLGGRRTRRGERDHSRFATGPAESGHQKHRTMEMWDNIKGALIGVAATRFKDFVGEVVPGFHEQYDQTPEKTETTTPPRVILPDTESKGSLVEELQGPSPRGGAN